MVRSLEKENRIQDRSTIPLFKSMESDPTLMHNKAYIYSKGNPILCFHLDPCLLPQCGSWKRKKSGKKKHLSNAQAKLSQPFVSFWKNLHLFNCVNMLQSHVRP